MKTIEKLLIANRGEIALRIMRTCREMGIATVAVFSDADESAPFVEAADEAVRIGPAPAVDSYLCIERIVDTAIRTGAGAIHPGYGFLAENAALARACAAREIVFVGPTARAIELLGSKLESKKLASGAGVPVIPTYDSIDDAELPVLLKASAGGGGKGMRIVRSPGELAPALESARREAQNAFGDDTMLIEKYIDRPRHVEFQILGDQHGNVIHVLERECSIQRRHQKVIEETPSPGLSPRLRQKMGEAATAIARAVDYHSAGTVEMILAPDDSFYVLEVNTRLQVEHPVTEMVTGLDLVREQIRIARGEPLSIGQDAVAHHGAAIECRLYAEDPASDDLPATGTVVAWRAPRAPGLRVDSGVRAGSEIGIHYDPMLAKLIAHAPTRDEAIQKLARALDELVVFGVTTNRELLASILRHPAFRAGTIDTHFLDEHGAEVRPDPPAKDALEWAACALTALSHERRRASRRVLPTLEPGYRSNRFADQRVVYRAGEDTLTVEYQNLGDRVLCVRVGDREPVEVSIARCGRDSIAIEIDGHRVSIPVAVDGARGFALVGGQTIELVEQPRFPDHQAIQVEGGCLAPMPGKITRLLVVSGAAVTRGETLVVLEAMKMEHSVRAPSDGVITELCVCVGDQVDADDLLVVVKAAD